MRGKLADQGVVVDVIREHVRRARASEAQARTDLRSARNGGALEPTAAIAAEVRLVIAKERVSLLEEVLDDAEDVLVRERNSGKPGFTRRGT